ncbi:MAG: lysophospholipid acyltransferase family protein [Hyphomicrobiales bacterium]
MSTLTARIAAPITRFAIRQGSQLITGARAFYHHDDEQQCFKRPCIYFANHRSHGDFVLLWSVLPPKLRSITRPVAGADYWRKSDFRRFIGEDVFNSLLIERDAKERTEDPIDKMVNAVANGDSLIIFPEGTRNMGEDKLLPFKSGLFHLARTLAKRSVEADFVPVWIDNLNRVMPKGEIIPVPLLCKIHFGATVPLNGANKVAYLERARESLTALSGENRGNL